MQWKKKYLYVVLLGLVVIGIGIYGWLHMPVYIIKISPQQVSTKDSVPAIENSMSIYGWNLGTGKSGEQIRLSGVYVPYSYIKKWSFFSIQFQIPQHTKSGIVYVHARNKISNGKLFSVVNAFPLVRNPLFSIDESLISEEDIPSTSNFSELEKENASYRITLLYKNVEQEYPRVFVPQDSILPSIYKESTPSYIVQQKILTITPELSFAQREGDDLLLTLDVAVYRPQSFYAETTGISDTAISRDVVGVQVLTTESVHRAEPFEWREFLLNNVWTTAEELPSNLILLYSTDQKENFSSFVSGSPYFPNTVLDISLIR